MSKRKRTSCWCICTLGGIILTFLLAIGGSYLWLWGWTWKSIPEFHESWTQEERAALTAFDRLLKDQMNDYVPAVIELGMRGNILTGDASIKNCVDYSCNIRNFFASLSRQLHEVIESGNASETEASVYRNLFDNATAGLTLVIVAVQHAQLDAMKALVQHGADPNTIARKINNDTENTELETPLTPLLNGNFITGGKIPWETRRKYADWLLEHGVDINGTKRITGISCDLPLMCGHEEGSAPWHWALDHGKTVEVNNLCHIAASQNSTVLLERIIREKRIDLNDASGKETVLQALMKNLAACDEEEYAELMHRDIERKLDILLAAGAAPNLVPHAVRPQQADESDAAYESRKESAKGETAYPLDIATRWLEWSDYPPMREYCRRIIDKLRAAGARPGSEQ